MTTTWRVRELRLYSVQRTSSIWIPLKIFWMTLIVLCVKVSHLQPLSQSCKLLYRWNSNYWLCGVWSSHEKLGHTLYEGEGCSHTLLISVLFVCLSLKSHFVNNSSMVSLYNLWKFNIISISVYKSLLWFRRKLMC